MGWLVAWVAVDGGRGGAGLIGVVRVGCRWYVGFGVRRHKGGWVG